MSTVHIKGGIVMKVFKKIVSVAVATVTSLCGLQIVSAGAFEPDAFMTSYRMSDINRNGTTNTTDSTILSNVLWGNRYVASNKLMDADGNRVISWADHAHIVAETVGNNSFNYVDGLSGVGFCGGNTTYVYTPSGQSTSCLYRKHLYSTGYGTSNDIVYNLSMTETAFPTGMSSPDVVIGNDGRVPETSSIYTGIVRIGGPTGGTGFVVGDHEIATAAHVVFNGNSWNTNSYFQFPVIGADGKVEVNTLTATKYYFKEAHIEQNYYTSQNDEIDYALITVNTDLSDCYHFSLGIPYDMYSASFVDYFDDYNLYVTGYPGDLGSGYTRYLFTAADKLYTGTGYQSDLLCYTTDTSGGDSGAPVYIKETVSTGNKKYSNYITVLGIHHGGLVESLDPNTNKYKSNCGAFFTPLRLKFFLNNPNASY